MPLFLVAVTLQPTKKQRDEEGALETIVVPPQAVVAKDDAQAAVKALKFVPDEHANKDDRLESHVLPFRSPGR